MNALRFLSLALVSLFLPGPRPTWADQPLRKPSPRQETPAAEPSTTFRLVDVEGRPVEGALVSTYFYCNRDRSASFLPPGSLQAKSSDARGEASLKLEIVVRGHMGVCAIREQPGEDRPLVGMKGVSRAEVGKLVTITMYPACRVRLRVECPGFQSLERKYNAELNGPHFRRAAHAFPGEPYDGQSPLYTESTSGVLEFFLPPGRYNVMITGADTTWETRSIEVSPGQRVRSLGVVELTPDGAIKQGIVRDFHHWTQPDPETNPNDRRGNGRPALRRVGDISLEGGAAAIEQFAFSPDGKLLATAHSYRFHSGEVKLWDARTGTRRADLPVPDGSGGSLSVAFSPDGKLLAGAFEGGRGTRPGVVALWDISTRQRVRTLEGHSGQIRCLVFSPDGLTLAGGGDDQSVRFWDVATGREARRLEDLPDLVRSLAYMPDGKNLLIGSGDTLRLWDLEGDRLRAVLDREGPWTSAALSPDGRTVALAGAGGGIPKGHVRLYDLSIDPPARRAELVFEREKTDQVHHRDSPFWDVVFTADGRSVVAVQMTTVVIWDAASGKLRDYFGKQSGSPGDRLAISPDGQRLVVTNATGASIVDITPPPAPEPSL